MEIRAERIYTVEMEEDCGGSDTTEITVEAGAEDEQDRRAKELAVDAVTEWVRGGDYGEDGASVDAWYTLSDEDYAFPRAKVVVEIEPDHLNLIRRAVTEARGSDADGGDYCGDDPDNHDWTSEGHGGCDENPGVWSTGGTSMSFEAHCTRCGLRRDETATGSQRNPGEHDTVSYRMESGTWCREHQAFDCEDCSRTARS